MIEKQKKLVSKKTPKVSTSLLTDSVETTPLVTSPPSVVWFSPGATVVVVVVVVAIIRASTPQKTENGHSHLVTQTCTTNSVTPH